MGVDPFDAYMEFKGGNSPKGESLDNEFGGKKACEIDSFEFGSSDFLAKSKTPEEAPDDDDLGAAMRRMFDPLEEAQDEPVVQTADRDKCRCFEIEKRIDTASPLLFQAYCSCAADMKTAICYDSVTISCRKPGDPPVVYLEVVFKKVYLTDYELELSESNLIPIEKIGFYFRECQVTYKPIDSKGAAESPIVSKWRFT